ncbi:hypothetical protein HAX54_029342 [Datura stramonium]|uniref:C2 domain-containing protein n=1 Tax=Datura stramonium TaxID=4076 RepID=A0ABS8V8D6_DATST|nr:hypothetical protein [Datura stramonium]
MELRPLDIKVISADGIKNVNTFSKMDVYAEVSISSYSTKVHKQKTFVDKNSGTNPKWNHSMKFTLDESSLAKPGLYLVFRLKSERTLGDKEIGEVSVPIHDLFNQSTSEGTAERFVEYPVITESGKPKGTLKFSYKFGEKFTAPEQKRDVNHEPVTAYPAPMHAAGAPYGNSYPGMAYNQQNSEIEFQHSLKAQTPEQKRDVNHEPVTAYPAPMHAAGAPYGNSYPGMAYNQQNSGYGYLHRLRWVRIPTNCCTGVTAIRRHNPGTGTHPHNPGTDIHRCNSLRGRTSSAGWEVDWDWGWVQDCLAVCWFEIWFRY